MAIGNYSNYVSKPSFTSFGNIKVPQRTSTSITRPIISKCTKNNISLSLQVDIKSSNGNQKNNGENGYWVILI